MLRLYPNVKGDTGIGLVIPEFEELKHRLRAAREAAEKAGKIVNVKDLARQAGVSEARIYAWEAGERPSESSTAAVAKPLWIDAGWLAVGSRNTSAPISKDADLAVAIAANLRLELTKEANREAADVAAAADARVVKKKRKGG